MDGLTGLIDSWWSWIVSHSLQLFYSSVIFIIVYLVYKFISKQINRLEKEGKLEKNTSFTFKRIFKWVAGLTVVGVFFAQFGIGVGVIGGFMALAGGTIIGFAAINTIGNAIAGIIIMVSRPFKVGDRISFKGELADIIAIDLIYTRMETLDNVYVSIPNQELLTSEIGNYGTRRVIRRTCTITAGYDLDFEYVEDALLHAAKNVRGILKSPVPFVRITNFKDFAVEYVLYVFVDKIRRLRDIDADLRKTVFAVCKSRDIDISTPSLVQSVGSSDKVYIPEKDQTP